MAYDNYNKRQRMDGNNYGMGPPGKRMATSPHQEYGNMSHGRGGGGYNDYMNQTPKMSRSGSGHEEKQSNVLFFSVYNAKYPITVDVMHTITSPHGTVNRIVIFRKNGIQSMVEFETIEEAERAKDALNGADIYSGCCTLKVEWGKPTRLNVVKNDSDSWDYTNPNLGKEQQSKNQPLLPDPNPNFQQSGNYGGNHMDRPPARRGPPMDYGYDDYGGPGPQPPFDTYGPPSRGGPGHGPGPGHFPEPGPGYDDMYGPPRPVRGGGLAPPRGGGSMRGGPPRGPGGPPPPRGPMHMSEFGDDGMGGGMLQQGSVVMVYGLNVEKVNCECLFNLFCLYGNVVRVKFLKSKEGVAMVQLGDNLSCSRAIANLNGCFFFDNKMSVSVSKQAFIQDVHNPVDLADGSPSFKDFMGSRNNRFSTPEAAAKNRIQGPSKSLYFYNTPPNIDEDTLRKLFVDLNVTPPTKLRVFLSKNERSSTGILDWDNKSDSIEALVMANHSQLPSPSGKAPYIMKLCFSGSS